MYVATELAQAYGTYGSSQSTTAAVAASVIGFLVGGLIGWLIGNSRGYPLAGFLLGGFCGCIGWIIVLLLPKKYGYRRS